MLADLKCDLAKCTLPNCRCQSSQTPGGLPTSQVPQMVLISFDGAVNQINHEFFTEVFDDRLNPNRCPIKLSFFVSDHENNYKLTQKLHRKGLLLYLRLIFIHSKFRQISVLFELLDIFFTIILLNKSICSTLGHFRGNKPFNSSFFLLTKDLPTILIVIIFSLRC